MTSRTANASRRPPGPPKQKSASPARPSPPADTPKKQRPSLAEGLPKSPQRGPDNSHGASQTEASKPTSANPTAQPKPFDRKTERTIPVKEAAYRLKKSEDTVYSWLRAGRLRGWQLGGPGCAVMVCEASVEEALAGSFGSDDTIHSA